VQAAKITGQPYTVAASPAGDWAAQCAWDNDNTLYVLSGTDLIQVNGLSSEQAAEALAKPVLDALH